MKRCVLDLDSDAARFCVYGKGPMDVSRSALRSSLFSPTSDDMFSWQPWAQCSDDELPPPHHPSLIILICIWWTFNWEKDRDEEKGTSKSVSQGRTFWARHDRRRKTKASKKLSLTRRYVRLVAASEAHKLAPLEPGSHFMTDHFMTVIFKKMNHEHSFTME